eukprot:scaffold1350_cov249-Pinguiococcus_pyrenoidosus.AAC.2
MASRCASAQASPSSARRPNSAGARYCGRMDLRKSLISEMLASIASARTSGDHGDASGALERTIGPATPRRSATISAQELQRSCIAG